MVNEKPFLLLSVEGPNPQGTQAGTLKDMDWAADNYCTVYKVCVQWKFLEPAKDSYDWTFLDELINKARSKNLKLHLIFNGFTG
jgi:GH35 family endo-1,4-beta-xylanase